MNIGIIYVAPYATPRAYQVLNCPFDLCRTKKETATRMSCAIAGSSNIENSGERANMKTANATEKIAPAQSDQWP